MSSQIAALATTGSAPSSAAATGSPTLGKDDFMKLLMTQLQNQDPTAPTDSNAFIAQLAQFSNIEQLQSVNGHLNDMALAQAGANQTAAATLVGKDIVYKSSALTLVPGQPAIASGELSRDASNVTAVVTDSSGRTVRTMALGGQAAGHLDVPWDGRDDGGHALPPGSYTVRLTASDSSGKSVPVVQTSRGRATGVSFNGGVPQLLVGGAPIPMGAILEIDQPAAVQP